nr:hypothetical protein [Tanacetum cinerariifolium]
MLTQQDIYVVGSESRLPMLNKENYVPWSSRLLRYAKSRPNGKLIHNFILNGPYVRKMIPEPGDANRDITVTETLHLQTDDELSDKELKQIEADDQAIQTILLGLPEDIYDAEKKAKLFNEWERFTSNEGESIESYYHRFLKLMNDLKRNKHFPEKIASNLKFLNNLQPEWSRHVTIVHQTKDLHTADYTQLYDFLKYNQKEVDELKAERLEKNQDPLALMANSNNPYAFPAPHQDQSLFNQNYLQQPMTNPEYITDPTTTMNMALALMAKAFKLNYSTPTNNNQRISSNPRNRQYAGNSTGYNDVIGNQDMQNAVQNPRVQNVRNQNGLIGVQRNRNQNQIGNGNLVAARAEGNAVGQNVNQIWCYNCRGVCHYVRNYTVKPRRRDAAYLQTELLIAQKEEAGIQLQAEEYDLMAAAADLDEIEEVNANCILMANLQQASTSEEQYTELLKPILESHQVPQNDNDVISEDTSVEQEAARTMLIFSHGPLFLWAEAIATACFTQNRSIIHRRFNKTPYELINGRKLDISFLHVFGALCYPRNDREDIGKLGTKGDIGFFIGSGLDLTYAPSTITTQQPSEGELDLLFKAMYDDYIGGQPSATARTILPAQEPQVRQSSTASTTIADTAPIPTNSSSLVTNIPITLQNVDELNPHAMVDGNTFVNPFANSSISDATASSSQQNVDPSNMHMFYQPYPHEFQWTKD